MTSSGWYYSIEEDRIIVAERGRDPPTDWYDIAKLLETRTDTSVKLRYQKYLAVSEGWKDWQRLYCDREYRSKKRKIWKGFVKREQLSLTWDQVELIAAKQQCGVPLSDPELGSRIHSAISTSKNSGMWKEIAEGLVVASEAVNDYWKTVICESIVAADEKLAWQGISESSLRFEDLEPDELEPDDRIDVSEDERLAWQRISESDLRFEDLEPDELEPDDRIEALL